MFEWGRAICYSGYRENQSPLNETYPTYDEIKEYVFEHNAGMKVSNLYISQVKRKCGIEVGKNYNLPKNEDSRQPQCPEDKESAIVEALKHFKMNS